MKAAQIGEYGGPDKIVINEVTQPVAKDGQVLVRVKGSSINPFDTVVLAGGVKSMMQLPVTLGGDIAGEVEEIGAGVAGLNVGDRVYGSAIVLAGGSGAFAEYAVANAAALSAMPKSLDFIESGVLPLTGASAVQAITEHFNLQAGQRILIHGAAGGIGCLAVQIAKHLGAYVAATASGAGIDFVKSLGADEVIDYKTRAFEEILRDFDAVYDTVSGETYLKSLQVLKTGGVIVTMQKLPDRDPAQQYGVTSIAQQTKITAQHLSALAKLVDDGAVKPHMHKVFPLAQTAEAFRTFQAGGVLGKIAIQI